MAIFSKTVVAEEGMAMGPPLGMATVRTSMAIAGGSGERIGFREMIQCHFHLQWRQKQTPQIVDCMVCLPWRIVRREK